MKNLLLKHRAKFVLAVIASLAFIGGLGFIKASDPVKLDVQAYSNSIDVSWVTPKDAVKQEVRYSTSPIDTTNFDNATNLGALPELVQGQKQSTKIGALQENVTYYVAYKYYVVDQVKTEQVKAQKNNVYAAPSVYVKPNVATAKSEVAFEVAGIVDRKMVRSAQVVTDVEPVEVSPVEENSAPVVGDVADVQYTTGYAFAAATTNDKDVVAPEQVKDLTYTATSNSITISWIAPADKDLDTYVVKYNTTEITKDTFSTDGTVANVPVGLPGQKQEVKVDGLTVGKVYYFAVVAKDFSGNTSNMATIKTGTDGVVVLQGQASVNAVTLLWLTPSGVTQHEMRYSTNVIDESNYNSASLVTNLPAILPGQNQMVTVGQLVPATNYYFAYHYLDASNVWQLSTVMIRTLSNDLIAPSEVTNFNVFAQQNNLYLSWKSPSDPDLAGFHVRYATFVINKDNFNSATVANNTPIGQPGAIQSMSISNLQVFTKYYVAIMAVDTSGNESPLTVGSAITGGTGINGISFVALPSVNSVTLFWITPKNLDKQEIKYSTSPIDPSNYNQASLVRTTPAPIPGEMQSATVDQLTPNTKYYFAFRGVNLDGIFYEYVSTVTLTYDITAPGPVTSLALAPTANSITVNWTSPSDRDLAGFHVRYATYELNSGNFNTGTVANNTPIGVPGANQTMTISGLNPTTAYWVGIMAVDTSGNESPLRVNSVTTLGGGVVITTGGGGGSSGGAVYHGAFIGPYIIKINNGDKQTFSRNVNLNVDCGGNVRAMAVSNLADLSGAQIVEYKQLSPWVLTEGVGPKTVYARCFGYDNLQSPIVSASIELIKGDGNYVDVIPVVPTPVKNPNLGPSDIGQVLGIKIRPDNTLVRTPDEKVFLISNGGKKTRIVSVFDLYYKFKGQPIENITFAELAQYPDLNKPVLGTKIFANGTLVRAEDYRVYVIENGYKRYLPTLEDIRAYKHAKIQNVTYTDLEQYQTVSIDTTRHNNLKVGEGTMIRDSKGNIYVIRNGSRHYIPGFAETFERYANVPVINVSDEVANSYPLDGPYPHTGKAYIGLGIYANGTLIRTPDEKIFEVNEGYGDPVTLDQLKTKYAGKKIINVNQYFAIPSPKPLY